MKLTSLKRKIIANVESNGRYITLHLATPTGRAAGALTINADNLFDKDGNRIEDDTP